MFSVPTSADVLTAAKRLERQATQTPVFTSSSVDRLLGAEVYFKCENLQKTGAFKFRGAFNAISQFTPAQRRHGVVAFSTGNHAQAIAMCARWLDMPAVVVMPNGSSAIKVAAARGYGAEVIFYDRSSDDREQIAAELTTSRGLTLVPPYDHPDVIAGQGTAALELFAQVGELDHLFVPVGGGGMLAGSILARDAARSKCQIIGVEPAVANDAQISLRMGRIHTLSSPPQTIADGAQTVRLGELTFAVIRPAVLDIVTVSDRQLIESLTFLAERMKLVVEPTGCLGFAGARHCSLPLKGGRIGVMLTGGNIELQQLKTLLNLIE